MPDSIQGFTRDELIDLVLDTVGRTGDSTLRSRLEGDINFAQLKFWKAHDWKFSHKNGVTDLVSFPLVTGQSTYTLNTAAIGYEMRNTDIDRIYIIDPSYTRTLERVSLRDIRNADPSRQANTVPEFYSASADNSIEVWPIPDANVNGIEVYIDGRVLPAWLSTADQYLSVPIEFQETFYQYFLYRTLSRERDPRQKDELIIYQDMLRTDIREDMREKENNLHIKFPGEEIGNNAYPSLANTLKIFNDDFY